MINTDEMRAKQNIAAMAGMLVDGREQNYSYGALLKFVFRTNASEAICGSRIAGMLADILDGQSTRYQDALLEAKGALETASRFYAKKSRPPTPAYLVRALSTINKMLGGK